MEDETTTTTTAEEREAWWEAAEADLARIREAKEEREG